MNLLLKITTITHNVSVAKWANMLSEPPTVPARPCWLMTCDGLGSNPGRGVSFQLVALTAGML